MTATTSDSTLYFAQETAQENKDKAMLLAKLSAVSGAVGRIAKSSRNDQQNYNYAGAEAVFAQVRDALQGQGVWSLYSVDQITYNTVAGRNSNRQQCIIQTTHTYVDLETGYEITVGGAGEGMDSGDKALYKAETGGYRHHLLNFFLIPTGGTDPEADTKLDQEIAKDMADGYTLEFGKHSGKLLADVVKADPGWVKWASENAREDRDVFKAALANV